MQSGSEHDIIYGERNADSADAPQESSAEQERLARLGETILDRGGTPSEAQLAAMGLDEPTARGIQSLVWLSKEGDPEARRAVEAMVDLTAPRMKLEEQREAGFTRVPVDADDYALIGFNGANSSTDVRMEGIDNYAGEHIGQGSKSGEITIPACARNIAEQVKNNNGTPLKGYKGGKIYRNTPVAEDSQKLPEGVNYREYDIHPYIKGKNRGTERIVIGDDGLAWYTNDHYQTFTRIE